MTTPNNAAALVDRLIEFVKQADFFSNESHLAEVAEQLATLRATLAHEASGADWHWLRTDDWSEIVQAMPLGDDRYATGYQDAMNAVTRKLCSLPRPVINPAQPDALTSQPSGEAVEGWPEYLMLRDTKLHDDMGGLGQRIFTTAGAGYEKRKYIRADLATNPSADAPGVAVDEMQITKADFMKAVSIELMLTFADDSASAGKAYTAISKVTAAIAPKPEGGHAD